MPRLNVAARLLAAAALAGLVAHAPLRAADSAASAIAYWSADELQSGRATRLPLTTATHAFNVIRATAEMPPEAHEGTSDIIFVVAGSGSILAGGALDGAAPLENMPGELRGGTIANGRRYPLAPGAAINIPPSVPYQVTPAAGGLTAMRLKVNAGMHPWPIAQTQQWTLAATPDHPRANVATSVGQGGVVAWPADTLLNAHRSLVARADAGQPFNDPRDFVDLPITPTHAYNFLHRRVGANGQPPAVEYHEGTTDVYFILAGTGTVVAGGTIDNRRHVANKPGEDQGTTITGGTRYRVKAGDVINMPPGTPHQSLPDAAGFSYLLVKVNTGVYPWSLIALDR